ncbi:DNA methylase domain protein [Mycobacterium xenopi 4042]|uniref:DNA methylase domain protein n=1 Tax=Mycobacterium xenopi 4042 TaxID=1299334 RepID=X7YQB0_MYCXE|nr:DNA methylase domain protein [Mycobacterium xenopi 4042]
MKREFGSKLIEEFLPTVDLRVVIDTSGAYIPGHGTPTAILVGRNQRPSTETIRAVLGIRGEPAVQPMPRRALSGRRLSSTSISQAMRTRTFPLPMCREAASAPSVESLGWRRR